MKKDLSIYDKGRYDILCELRNKFVDRKKRYHDKKLLAKDTDKVNQGAKIKALNECITDINVKLLKMGMV